MPGISQKQLYLRRYKKRRNLGRAIGKYAKLGIKWNDRDAITAIRANERTAGVAGECTADDLKNIREKQQDKCIGCGWILNGKGSLDHIIPISKGGSSHPSNLQWLCCLCNSRKGNKSMDEFKERMKGKTFMSPSTAIEYEFCPRAVPTGVGESV